MADVMYLSGAPEFFSHVCGMLVQRLLAAWRRGHSALLLLVGRAGRAALAWRVIIVCPCSAAPRGLRALLAATQSFVSLRLVGRRGQRRQVVLRCVPIAAAPFRT